MSREQASEQPGFRLESVDWDDPRAQAMRDAMDVEIGARYGYGAAGGLPTESLRVLIVDPADVVTTQLAVQPDGTPVGHAGLRRLGDELEVKRVVVAASVRGRGVARALMAEVERTARELGARRVILQTGDRQPEAEALYEALGYTRIPIYEPYVGPMPFSRCFEKLLR